MKESKHAPAELYDYKQEYGVKYGELLRKETGIDQYLDLQSLVTRYSQFTENQIRWLVVKKDENGLAPAIKRLGRRLYFHMPTFLAWIEKQNA